MIAASLSGERLVRKSLDGSSVILTGPEGFFAEGQTTHLVVQIDSKAVEFEAGDLTFADQVAEWLGIQFVEKFDLEGGLLQIGQSPDEHAPVCLGGWFGSDHSLKAAVKGIAPAVMASLFASLQIDEQEQGIVLTPGPGSGATFPVAGYPPEVTQPLQRHGLLEVFPLTPALVSGLPRWEGLATPGGELFLEEGEDDASTTFLLVSDTAQARLYPNSAVVTLEEAADEIAKVHVEWSPL